MIVTDSANEAESELEQDAEVTEVAELATMLETIV